LEIQALSLAVNHGQLPECLQRLWDSATEQ